ncbi:MAG: hypothetical protein WAT58_05380 [Candidatus Dormiibacterota bacterium]
MTPYLQVVEGVAGAALLLIVLVDIFNAVIVPRPTARSTSISRYTIRPIWRLWRAVGNRSTSITKREAILGIFAPAAIVILLVVWILLEILSYALLVHALRADFTPQPRFFGAVYVAASSLFGVGQSGYIPSGHGGRMVVPAINATGLGTVALVITFLFSLYGSFQKREALVVTLDARAGAPPSGVTLLETHAKYQMLDRLPQLFLDWERWSAEVLDSHLAYPILTYFRSSHDNESWISALGAVLDATALLLATHDHVPVGSAKMMHAMGTHLVEDLSYRFGLENDGSVMVERQEFEDARRRLMAVGLPIHDDESGWESFSRMRSQYASRLNAMAQLWASPPAQWIGDRSSLLFHDRHSHQEVARENQPAEQPAP